MSKVLDAIRLSVRTAENGYIVSAASWRSGGRGREHVARTIGELRSILAEEAGRQIAEVIGHLDDPKQDGAKYTL